jgi:hypothetical protein
LCPPLDSIFQTLDHLSSSTSNNVSISIQHVTLIVVKLPQSPSFKSPSAQSFAPQYLKAIISRAPQKNRSIHIFLADFLSACYYFLRCLFLPFSFRLHHLRNFLRAMRLFDLFLFLLPIQQLAMSYDFL